MLMRRKEFVPDLLRYGTSCPKSAHLPGGQSRLCQVDISGGALRLRDGAERRAGAK
jgi:hypothetical protein